MPLTTFDILDKAVAAGGANLSATALGGSGAGPKAVRGQLCQARLLKLEGSKFSLTEAGRAEWQKDALPARVAEVAELERQQAARRLSDFVAAVQKKNGTAFTAPQLATHAEGVRADATRRGYVRQGEMPPRSN